ncbi:innexin-3-like [Pomacea canaliculata]|uniref:innexin-3-like n=1 Tax=Pomacea canaliculata TaxID=400727 RepID=UPI000D73D10B|nr:innexin-3-like [Pomacea canaliculata]
MFIDYDTEIPHDPTQRQSASRQKMDGYPMVPVVLILLAFCLQFPSFLWQECSDGLSKRMRVGNVIGDTRLDEGIANIIINRQSLKRVEQGRSRRALSAVCLRVLSACGLFMFGKRFGTYETGLLMLTKLVTVCLLGGAFVVLASFMQTDVTWGWNLLYDRLTWRIWTAHGNEFFPAEVLCEVKVRQMQNEVMYTVQCVLPINMWNEKVFAVLWFWLLFLLLLSIYSYMFWFRVLMFSSSRHRFLLKLSPKSRSESRLLLVGAAMLMSLQKNS